MKGARGNAADRVTEADKGQSFLICLDGKLKDSAITAMGLKKDDLFICCDVALAGDHAASPAWQRERTKD